MPSLIGSRILRLEDEPLLRGRGRFVDDLAVPGLLHAAFVRSPHPHALIRNVAKAGRAGAAGRARGAHARRSRAGAGAAAHDCGTRTPAIRSTPSGRSRSPTARSPMSASRSRSWWREAATSPRTRPRWSRSITRRCRRPPIAAKPRVRAPAVRREITSNIIASFKVSYGDVAAAFAGRRTCSARSSGSIAAPAIRSRAAASWPNGMTPTTP